MRSLARCHLYDFMGTSLRTAMAATDMLLPLLATMQPDVHRHVCGCVICCS